MYDYVSSLQGPMCPACAMVTFSRAKWAMKARHDCISNAHNHGMESKTTREMDMELGRRMMSNPPMMMQMRITEDEYKKSGWDDQGNE